MRSFDSQYRGFKRFRHWVLVISYAVLITALYFLILPLMQTIGRPDKNEMTLRSVGVANVPPPPPPPMEESEPEEEEPPPPSLADEAPPLDLSQLELALNPGFGDGWGGDFAVRLQGQAAQSGSFDEIFSLADLDQKPRVVYQPAPQYPPELRRKKVEGTVYIIFVVNAQGRVMNPKVQKSTHPAFEGPALKAVRRWKFEPGKRGGKAVQFRMRVPITFTAG